MATAYVTASATFQLAFTTPANVKGKITAVNVNNGGGASGHNINITDTFLPDASAGQPSPVSSTLYLIPINVPMGAMESVDQDSLQDVETLGVVGAVSDAQDSGCQIMINYHFESK